MASIAFGRDSTGTFGDRCLGLYVLQYTTADAPDASTPDDAWIAIGIAENGIPCPPIPAIRHRYNFAPVEATAIRLLVPGTGIDRGACIDELEVYAEPGAVFPVDGCSGPTGPIFHRGDADADGKIDITDAVFLLEYLFLAGPEPAPPGPEARPCGPDPEASPADLGCLRYDPCGA